MERIQHDMEETTKYLSLLYGQGIMHLKNRLNNETSSMQKDLVHFFYFYLLFLFFILFFFIFIFFLFI